jgi:hypothetical protein
MFLMFFASVLIFFCLRNTSQTKEAHLEGFVRKIQEDPGKAGFEENQTPHEETKVSLHEQTGDHIMSI